MSTTSKASMYAGSLSSTYNTATIFINTLVTCHMSTVKKMSKTNADNFKKLIELLQNEINEVKRVLH